MDEGRKGMLLADHPPLAAVRSLQNAGYEAIKGRRELPERGPQVRVSQR